MDENFKKQLQEQIEAMKKEKYRLKLEIGKKKTQVGKLTQEILIMSKLVSEKGLKTKKKKSSDVLPGNKI